LVYQKLNQNSTSRDFTNRLRQERNDQWFASLIALLIALALHVFLFFMLPDEFFMKQSGDDSPQDETIELMLEELDPEMPRYVEANPEAPKNEPDRSDNYSFRSQQSADENPDASQDNLPTVEGDEASQKIVQGSVDLSEPVPLEGGVYALSAKSADNRNDSADSTQASSSIQPTSLPPAPDFIQQKPQVEEGPGSNLTISGSSQQVAREYSDINAPIQLYRMDSENQQDVDTGSESNRTAEAKPMPRKRLTLPPDLVYGPLMRSKGSASLRGALAIDATFSQFGEYEQQFYAAVQAGWYQEIEFFQPIDTSARVVVQFRIHADGTVDDVEILNSTAGEIATLICQTALTKRSPFRPWTAEMIKTFGQERIMKVSFSYR
jgi:hypothetical protein